MKTSLDCNGVKTCPDCNGDGVVDKDTDDERQCRTCGGLGFVRDEDDQEEVIKTSGDLPHRQGAAWTRRRIAATLPNCQRYSASPRSLGLSGARAPNGRPSLPSSGPNAYVADDE